MKRLIDYNPDSGIWTWHELDRAEKKTVISYTYDDVDGILDNNKMNYNHVNGWNADRSLHKVATIPLSIINKWLIEEGLDIYNGEHADRLKKKLNDPEWRFLRTSPGVV